jgi:hypothetical protein
VRSSPIRWPQCPLVLLCIRFRLHIQAHPHWPPTRHLRTHILSRFRMHTLHMYVHWRSSWCVLYAAVPAMPAACVGYSVPLRHSDTPTHTHTSVQMPSTAVCACPHQGYATSIGENAVGNVSHTSSAVTPNSSSHPTTVVGATAASISSSPSPSSSALLCKREFALSADEVRIFALLRDTIEHFQLDTTARVAGGWVRNKLLAVQGVCMCMCVCMYVCVCVCVCM